MKRWLVWWWMTNFSLEHARTKPEVVIEIRFHVPWNLISAIPIKETRSMRFKAVFTRQRGGIGIIASAALISHPRIYMEPSTWSCENCLTGMKSRTHWPVSPPCISTAPPHHWAQSGRTAVVSGRTPCHTSSGPQTTCLRSPACCLVTSSALRLEAPLLSPSCPGILVQVNFILVWIVLHFVMIDKKKNFDFDTRPNPLGLISYYADVRRVRLSHVRISMTFYEAPHWKCNKSFRRVGSWASSLF